MAFQSGLIDVTAPDEGHIRALKHLRDFISGSHVGSIAINAGGSSYDQGDVGTVLTVNGGTTQGDSSLAAEVEITEVNNGSGTGAVTGARLVNSGSYSIEPATLSGNSPTGSTTGSGFTVDLTMDSWLTAEIAAGGSSYSVSDVLTVSGGTGTAATFEVTAVSSGAVTAVKPVNIGAYTELPTNPASTTGGSGTGCTLTLTRSHWIIHNDDYSDDETDFEFYCEGVNFSGANPFGAFLTHTSTEGPQWMFIGATGYNSGGTFFEQTNRSPASSVDNDTEGESSRIPLSTSDMDFFFFANSRRIIVVMKIGNSYEFMYLGLFFPFQDDPATKYPLPFWVSGPTSAADGTVATGEGTTHNIGLRHSNNSGHFLRDPVGVWREPSTSNSPWSLWPYKNETDLNNEAEAQAPNIASGSGFLSTQGAGVADYVADTYYESTATARGGYGSFGIGSRTYLVEPYTFVQDEVGAVQVLGELDGVFAIQGRGVNAEDLILDQNGRAHQVFPNLSSTGLDDFYTIVRD